MKHHGIFLAIAVLVLASLACQLLTGGGGEPPPPPSESGDTNSQAVATEESGSSSGGGTNDSGFPMTDDAYNIIDSGDGSLIFYTKLSLEDVMKFYRDEYISRGYQERDLLTVVSDGTFSMVFDGDASGKAVVIQSVDLGDGSRTVAIRLEEV
jgi:hypothetical protein